jgi:PAS domain S-box-containing protein
MALSASTQIHSGDPVTIMSHPEFELQGVGDPRLAVHATSPLPAWLWSIDGSRVLWANPVGARSFGATNSSVLARKTFGPADRHRRQIAQLAGRLPATGAIRLERLRGFGAALGRLMTCSCSRLVFPDGSHGILIAAQEASETSARAMPLIERLQRLVEGVETPIVAFARDGLFVGASDAARSLLGFPALSAAGLDAARSDALANGRVEMPIGAGHMVLQRVGTGSDIGLVALIAPGEAQQPIAAGETIEPAADEIISPAEDGTALTIGSQPAEELPEPPTPKRRRHPLRFAWQMDAEERFSLGSDEFTRLIGPRTAVGFGRPWREIAEIYGLDPSGRVLEAIAARDAWSGITIYWPVDGGGRLPVELSGLPVYDQDGDFAGYQGVGVCRVLDSLDHLEELRGLQPTDVSFAPIHPADTVPTDLRHAPAAEPPTTSDVVVLFASLCAPLGAPSETPASIADDSSPPTDLDETVEMPENVVPFRPVGEPKSPALTAVENNAFDELARQLSARLDRDNGETDGAAPPSSNDQPGSAPPDWLAPPEPPARGESGRDRALLDLLPTGILIYRLDRLLYANPAFLQRIGYDSLHALEHAGGLDALYVEAGVSSASSTSETGTPVTISASHDSSDPTPATEARLFTISWNGDSALALMFSPSQLVAPQVVAPQVVAPQVVAPQAVAPQEVAPAAVQRPIQDLVQELIEEPIQESTREPIQQPTSEPAQASPPPAAAGQASAEDLAAILDTTTEGIVMFDAEGNIHACNRSAEALFGYDGAEFVRRNLADLFAPESQRIVLEYLESIKGAGVAILLDHDSDVLGRVNQGGFIPLSMTVGRTRPDSPNFFAVFRDHAPSKPSESEPPQPLRPADRLANTEADMLARINHEVRTPLNAILGLAEVMIGERFGALGNERYIEYTRDIRAAGERVMAIINDLLELSRVETGKLDLAFANQNLNEMVESCVSVMQPQANRERIIIRTSLAQALPPVVADSRALRQITLNLIGNSIHLANPAGQVIVSTALSDLGEVVLRVRDTGHGLNDNEIAAALEPFRTPPPSDQASDGSAVNLSLTKALVEANRARFHIKTGGRSGTLIEVVFPRAMARA